MLNRDILLIYFNIKVCCVFSLESPHRGDSNEYTQHTIFNLKEENHPKYPIYNNVCSYGIFLGTREHVRNSCGKRAIGVRAIEVKKQYWIMSVGLTPNVLLVHVLCLIFFPHLCLKAQYMIV